MTRQSQASLPAQAVVGSASRLLMLPSNALILSRVRWICRLPNGDVRIFDVSESESGFSNSENLVPFLEAKQAEQALPNLSAEEQEAVDFLRLYRDGKRLTVGGRHAKAVEKFDAIAARFRKLTLTRLVRLDALSNTDLARTFTELTELADVESCRITVLIHWKMFRAVAAAHQSSCS